MCVCVCMCVCATIIIDIFQDMSRYFRMKFPDYLYNHHIIHSLQETDHFKVKNLKIPCHPSHQEQHMLEN